MMVDALSLNLVVEPKSRVDCEIIAIHGLTGDWQHTWCQKDFSRPWLDDFLPEDLPNARILSWGYNMMEDDDFGYKKVLSLGEQLLAAIKDLHEEQKLPIVFIAHSLGGIVLKRLLVEAQCNQPMLLEAVKGVGFLSTPQFQDPKEWANFSRAIRGNDTNMKSFARYDHLSKVDVKFSEMLHQNSNWMQRVCCFYEMLPVYRSGILVPRDKATINGLKEYGLCADHFTITRFTSSSDRQYQIVCGWMQSISQPHRQFIQPCQPILREGGTGTTPDGRARLAELLKRLTPDSADSMQTKYALALEDQGNYAKAEKEYREAMDRFKQPESHFTELAMFCRDRLALVLRSQGKYNEARKEYQQILESKTKLSPKDQTAIVSTTANLALTMQCQGEYKAAHDMLVEKLDSSEAFPNIGFDYVDVLGILAHILQDLELYQFSEYLSREVLWACVMLLGHQHPYTLNRLLDLSTLFSRRGAFPEAEQISAYALEGLKDQLSIYHPYVLHAGKQRADTLRYQGHALEARVALHSIHERQEEKLGREHPATLSTLCAVAASFILEGQLEIGQGLLYKAHEMQAAVLGKSHPDTLWTYQALGRLQLTIKPPAKSLPDEVDPEDLPEELRSFLSRPSKLSEVNVEEPQETLRTPQDLDSGSQLIRSLKSSPNSRCREAAFRGDEAAVKALLKHGADVDSVGGYYGTSLQAAAYSGNVELVRLLLRSGANVNIQSGVFHSALKAASFRGHAEIVQNLLDHNAAVDLQEPTTEIERWASFSPLGVAVLFGHNDVVNKILDAGADINAFSPIFGGVLRQAVVGGHDKTAELLLKRGADPDLDSGLLRNSSQEGSSTESEATVAILRCYKIQQTSSPDDYWVRSSDTSQAKVVNVLMRGAAAPAANTYRKAASNGVEEATLQPRRASTESFEADPTLRSNSTSMSKRKWPGGARKHFETLWRLPSRAVKAVKRMVD